MATWYKVFRGAVLDKCEASDKGEATAKLRPDSSKGEMVKSRASYELDKPSTREELSAPNPKLARNPQLRAFWATLTPKQRSQRTANARAGRLKRYARMTPEERKASLAHLRTPEVYAKKRVTIAKKRNRSQKWLETHYRGGTDSGAGESSPAGIGNPARSRK